MKKVQKIKFAICPYCGQSQFIMPKIGEELGETTCETCENKFDPTKEVKEPQ